MVDRTVVYVGYDAREHAAWMVCRDSLAREGVGVVPLRHQELRAEGLFDRPWGTNEIGQMVDVRDGRPFSTAFSHTRFLTPILGKAAGARWAVFVDCDFLFRTPIRRLIENLEERNAGKALYCVQHKFRDSGALKMDGQVQENYQRKLWSSLMVWDLSVQASAQLTAPDVNHLAGGDMHRLCWLKDEEIGSLDTSWNWIPDLSDPEIIPDAVHWSFGGPWFPKYEDAPYSEEWRMWYRSAVKARLLQQGRMAELFG